MSERPPKPTTVELTPVELDRARATENASGNGAGDRFVSPTLRIAGPERRLLLPVVLVGIFIAAAVVKPWGPPVPLAVAPDPTPVVEVVATALAAATPDETDLRRHCQEPLGWRVYSREGWHGRTVRAWRSVEPVGAAGGPMDPSVPVVQLGPGIEALGYCSPWTGVERPADRAAMTAWRLDPGRAGGPIFEPVRLTRVAPDAATPLGALYGPLDVPWVRAETGPEGWPAGRYVFALRSPTWQRWWAVDIATGVPEQPPAAASPLR